LRVIKRSGVQLCSRISLYPSNFVSSRSKCVTSIIG